jgi:hypothetical protein
MTSLIAWIGVDSRGPSSAYLASDSRISWSSSAAWDIGRKLFAAGRSPDIFGYCGDVLLPSLLLGQVSEILALGSTSDCYASPLKRHHAVVRLAEASLNAYPADKRSPFTLLHCARESDGMNTIFHLWRTDWDMQRGWSDAAVALPTESVLALQIGSGAATVSYYDAAWRQTSVGRTSRAVFSAFCDALASGSDSHSGGAPQLVALYRKGSGEHLGVVYNGVPYVLGMPRSHDEAAALRVEWRNELFERCDGASTQRLPGAQQHSRPRERGR